MIINTWSKKVVIIPYNCIPYRGVGKIPPGKKTITQYIIKPSEIALVQEYRKQKDGTKTPIIKIFCNYDIVPRQIENMYEYVLAVTADADNKPELIIEECPNLKLLFRLDNYVQLFNENLKP